MTIDDRSLFENEDLDPRLTPGMLVQPNGREDEYSKRSYQRLIQERGKTTLSVIYDMVRSAVLDEGRRDVVDVALMLGTWEYNAPGMNRLATIAALEDEAEVVGRDLEEDRARELDNQAQTDARAGVKRVTAPLSDGVEAEYYSYRLERHRLKLEIARERAEGHTLRDYTAVKTMIANGTPTEQVIDLLPVYFQKVLVMCNVSLARDDEHIERDHIERLVANQGPEGALRRRRGKGGWPGRRSRRADDDDDE